MTDTNTDYSCTGCHEARCAATPRSPEPATPNDLAMLAQYGAEALRHMEFFGVVERLRLSGHIASL